MKFGSFLSGWGEVDIFFDSRTLNRSFCSFCWVSYLFSWCHKLVKIFLSDTTFQTKLITSERGASALIRAIYRNKHTSFIKNLTRFAVLLFGIGLVKTRFFIFCWCFTFPGIVQILPLPSPLNPQMPEDTQVWQKQPENF